MKIYHQNPLDMRIGPLPETGKIILAIVIIATVFWIASGAATPVLNAQLEQNPLHLSTNDSTILQVLLTNPASTPQSNVKVTISTPGTTQLSVYPRTQTISRLGPQETRKLEFLIAPLNTPSNPFLPGTYRMDISTTLNNQTYLTSVFVNVEK